jgi:pilus assembly protein CpaF
MRVRVRYDHELAAIDLTPTAHVTASKFGEIRGSEAFDLLQLLNTGHSGTLSTIHANSAKQGLSRFTSCVLQSGIELPYRAIKNNIGDSLNVVIQIERRPGLRFVSEVLEINQYDSDKDSFELIPIYARTPQTKELP